MPYVHFWRQYVHQHGGAGGSTVIVDPAAAFAAVVCLFVIACWVAYQVQSRCEDCGAIPARCRCRREGLRGR